jgi:elongation factor P
MKINGNEIKPGNIILHNGDLYIAVKTDHVKPGKGGAFAQVELKSIVGNTKINERFRASETVEKVRLEQKDYQYLYAHDDMLVFMDTESYEQIELQRDFVGDRASFLQDGMMVTVESYEEKPLGISLPGQVTLEITEADPVVKGQTASSSYKPAMLENTSAALNSPSKHGIFTHTQRDGRRGPQGITPDQARFRRGRKSAGLAQGTSELRHQVRQANRTDPA